MWSCNIISAVETTLTSSEMSSALRERIEIFYGNNQDSPNRIYLLRLLEYVDVMANDLGWDDDEIVKRLHFIVMIFNKQQTNPTLKGQIALLKDTQIDHLRGEVSCRFYGIVLNWRSALEHVCYLTDIRSRDTSHAAQQEKVIKDLLAMLHKSRKDACYPRFFGIFSMFVNTVSILKPYEEDIYTLCDHLRINNIVALREDLSDKNILRFKSTANDLYQLLHLYRESFVKIDTKGRSITSDFPQHGQVPHDPLPIVRRLV